MSAKLKTPEMDALDIYRAHNQGKELALKAGHLERQSKLDEAKADKLRLEIQKFQAELAEVRKKVREATEARKQRKRFDYERTLSSPFTRMRRPSSLPSTGRYCWDITCAFSPHRTASEGSSGNWQRPSGWTTASGRTGNRCGCGSQEWGVRRQNPKAKIQNPKP
jgi:hypothetical protein